ncbi:MAG TPA: glycoside hydrolase family 31 protein [Methylocella sp.]|nr:glycoside hydrolase family 31 protein [Methylocella sp.]
MSLAAPPQFAITAREAGHLTLASDRGDAAHVFVLEEDVIRVLVLPGGRLDQPRTFAISPGFDDVAEDGRDRFDLAGFTLPQFALQASAESLQIETVAIRLSIRLAGFFCSWALRLGTKWQPVATDRPTQAYNFGWWDERVYHYLRREQGEKYLGLGECAGEMDRAGQRYRLTAVDAMGYNARTSDPLYKHIPFYITCRPEAGVAFGLFYDTLSDCLFDFGKELDNYHGPYRMFAADHGDLDYYFIAGPRVDQVVPRFTWLTGRPAFMPKWGLGYSGSSMAYADAPEAQTRLSKFLERCAEHDILCDSFHLSSGYTSIGDRRYVFTWNRSKFPDPAAFAQSYLAKGVRLCANVKPCLLRDHPLFAEAAQLGLLVADAEGEPSFVQFWDEIGAYLDFTQPKTLTWWKAKVKETLLAQGIAGTWNDNNEFEIWSDKALAHGFGQPRRARECRALQSLLMMRASRDAQKEHAPDKRPFLVSRSGTVGMHRYAQTWSGDNSTCWETLKYNLKMGLGLALSGVSNTGHDIGGFSGPAPDPELLVRWVQFGIFMPRFCIHSWHDDGTVNEPWMYPETTPFVRDLIKLRYRLIPYLYDLLWRYRRDYEPMIRPTFFDFPDDPHCWHESDEMMVGRALLVAPVIEPGHADREVYLPLGTHWYDFWSGEVFEGGQTISRPAPWSRPVVFARASCAIPVNVAAQTFAAPADTRGFMIFPPAGSGAFTTENFEDDGESEAYRRGEYGGWCIEVEAEERSVSVRVQRFGAFTRCDAEPRLILPENETRSVSLSRP